MGCRLRHRGETATNNGPIMAPAAPYEPVRKSSNRAGTTAQRFVTPKGELTRGLGKAKHPAHTESIEARSPVRPPWHVLHAHSFARAFAQRVVQCVNLFLGVGLEADRGVVANS